MATSLEVQLGPRSYPIVIGSGLLGGGFDLAAHVHGPDCVVVSNDVVAPLYFEKLEPNLGDKQVTLVELPDGEAHKTLATAARIIDRLVDSRAGRDTTVIALGGGVVGDIAGFAAASYMRGVAFVQVPTTLLAQVDSSVGGKTGVNHPGGKNLIGAFHQPSLVLIDTDTLATLPDREFRAGLFADHLPRHDVGMMFEVGNDHPVARSEIRAQETVCNQVDAFRRAANKNDLGSRCRVDE